ncbi:MAG: hypothetical protein HC837_20495 [Chloroflexaceae bacterium]|nr:hypothetical protein [Chloroflexaceae bacterium]
MSGEIVLAQTSTPAQVPAGMVAVYCKSDGKCYRLAAGASEVELGSGGGVASGSTFPAGAVAGDIFYREDLRRMGYYDGSRWLGERVVAALGNFSGFASPITGNTNVYIGVPAAWWLDQLDLAYHVPGSALGGAVFWHVRLIVRSSTNVDSDATTLTINANTSAWNKTSITSFTPNPLTTQKLIYLRAEQSGAMDNLSLAMTLYIREVLG